MNKIKALYDVVKTMKEKEACEGILQVNIEKDGQQVWNFQNEFQRSEQGRTKCNLQTQWNWDGNEGSHESTTEFTKANHTGCPFHGRGRHFGHHGHFGHGHKHGFKNKADGFLFLLRILNELKVEEQGENVLFSLALDDEVKKIREKFQEKCNNKEIFHEAPHHHPFKGKLIKEIMLMNQPHILVNIVTNKGKAVEKAVITIEGSYEQEGRHELKAKVEINLAK